MKRESGKLIKLLAMVVIAFLLLPVGIMAEGSTVSDQPSVNIENQNADNQQENDTVSNQEAGASVIATMSEVANLDVNENPDQQLVVIYADSSAANVKDLSLTTNEVKSGERISDRVDVIEPSENTNIDELMTELKNNPKVLSVCKNGEIQVSSLPNDPYVTNGSAWQFTKIGENDTWDQVSNSEPVVVAVIDTGLQTNHPDLAGNTVTGYDYVTGSQAVVDIAGHGTEVSGCIAAVTNNGSGTAGVSGTANIKIAPYRTGGKYDGDTSLNVAYICAALMDAANRSDVRVINMSFGGYDGYTGLEDAVKYAVDAGKILVGASGNEGDVSTYAGKYSYPASYDGVISVAATTSADGHASFSQYNDRVDLCAPGQSVMTTDHNGLYKAVSGTSFASPIVAGACAVLLAKDPSLTATQVETILKDTALDLGTAGKDNYFGAGRIQLAAAVAAVSTPLNVDRFETDKTSGQAVNTSILLSAAASGGTSPYQYKFYYQLGSSKTVIRDYASTDTATFKPSVAGSYSLFVDVKDAEGTVVTKTISGYEIKVPSIDGITCGYRTHVQDQGWQDWQTDGALSGTTGQSLRLEGIEIKMNNLGYDVGVEYQTQVQDIGWQGWKSNGDLSGTTGQSLRLEGIQIRLTGSDADKCDIYYQVHAENYGWLDWAKNGESAGTEGLSLRLEAIRIKVVPKGSVAPGPTERPFIKDLDCSYQTHVQNLGWQGWKSDGVLSGTTGQSLRLEGIQIKVPDQGADVGIEYQTQVQDIGWQGFKSDGVTSGTFGQSLRLEAIQIRLTGADASQYDVYYQVHAENYGWLDWAKNGASAGTEGLSLRLEAIRIEIVPKGAAAPGATSRPFVKA